MKRLVTTLPIPFVLITAALPAAEPNRIVSQRVTTTLTTPSLIVTEFAVPVAVPVAPFSPVWYGSSVYAQSVEGRTGFLARPQNVANEKTDGLGSPSHRNTDAGSVGNEAKSPSYKTAAAVLQQRCASCHGGAAPKGGLDLNAVDVAKLARDVRQEILLRITSSDAGKQMPPAGEALTSDEFQSLVKEFVR